MVVGEGDTEVEEDILVGFVESDKEVTTGVVVAVFVKDE